MSFRDRPGKENEREWRHDPRPMPAPAPPPRSDDTASSDHIVVVDEYDVDDERWNPDHPEFPRRLRELHGAWLIYTLSGSVLLAVLAFPFRLATASPSVTWPPEAAQVIATLLLAVALESRLLTVATRTLQFGDRGLAAALLSRRDGGARTDSQRQCGGRWCDPAGC